MIDLTADEIVNTLVMTRPMDSRLVIVVEGEEDLQLLDIHMDEQVAYLAVAGSKSAAIGAARQFDHSGFNWAMFLVDADFDRLLGDLETWPPNVLASRNYDLLMDVAEADWSVVVRALIAHAPAGCERALRSRFGEPVIDTVIRPMSEAVGGLRLATRTNRFPLSSRGWNFAALPAALSAGNLVQVIAAEAHKRSSGQVSVADLEAAIASHLSMPDRTQLISGHDMSAAVSALIRLEATAQVAPSTIAGSMRVGLSCPSFLGLAVVVGLRDWAALRAGRPLFRCEGAAA